MPGRMFFRYRGYTPLPFVVLLIVFAEPAFPWTVAGAILIVAGEGIRLWGVSIAGSETRITESVGGSALVTAGPYSYVRNPLYLGNVMIYTGLGLVSQAFFPWLQIAGLLFFFVQYRAIVSTEEEYLVAKFGALYEKYFAAVPRFIPHGRRYGSPSGEFNLRMGWKSERRSLQAIVGVAFLIAVAGYIRIQ